VTETDDMTKIDEIEKLRTHLGWCGCFGIHGTQVLSWYRSCHTAGARLRPRCKQYWRAPFPLRTTY